LFELCRAASHPSAHAVGHVPQLPAFLHCAASCCATTLGAVQLEPEGSHGSAISQSAVKWNARPLPRRAFAQLSPRINAASCAEIANPNQRRVLARRDRPPCGRLEYGVQMLSGRFPIPVRDRERAPSSPPFRLHFPGDTNFSLGAVNWMASRQGDSHLLQSDGVADHGYRELSGATRNSRSSPFRRALSPAA